MVFCRYECFRLLDEYSVIIWSDYDVVIIKNLSELLEPCPSGIKLIEDDMRALDISTIFATFLPSIKEANMEKYNLEEAALSSAVIVLFDKLERYTDIYEWCIRETIRLGKHLYLTELSIFNLLIQEFNLKIHTLKSSIYCPHPARYRITEETKIIHAYSQPKFWNGLYNVTWEKNYKTWIKMGGSRLSHRKISYRVRSKIVSFRKKTYKTLKKFIKWLVPNKIYQFIKLKIFNKNKGQQS